MIGKFIRYYHTVKHLKPIQIRYQLYYRFRDRFFSVTLPPASGIPSFREIELYPFPNEKTSHTGHNRFRFLNLEHEFAEKIDWNHTGHGKLWAYKLNYFEFLLQSGMQKETGFELIRSYIQQIDHSTEGLEPYPLSLRGINWIKFMALHNDFPEDVVQSLHQQYQLLTQKIEYHLLGNHLLENGFSLLFGGIFFRDEKLLAPAREILTKELEEQILPDGAHFELSPMYHSIILQRVLDCINLLKQNPHEEKALEQLLIEKASKMAGWLRTIQFSDGSLPMVNDSVRGEFIEPVRLLEYAEQLDIAETSSPLKECGYRKLTNRAFELFLDAGQIGPDYIPGHAHADTLSFILYHKGHPLIVDRGVSTYEKNELREEERGTASHNTVMVNGREQSDVWGGFRVGRRAECKILAETENEVEAEHDGYESIGAMHRRKWVLSENGVTIKDRVDGNARSCTAHFHFAPGIKPEKTGEQMFDLEGIRLQLKGASRTQLKTYSLADGFHTRVSAHKLEIDFDHQLKTILT